MPANVRLFSTENLDRGLWRELVEGSEYANLFQDEDWATFREKEREHSMFLVAKNELGQLAGIRIWRRRIRFGVFLETAGGPLYHPGSDSIANSLLDHLLPIVRPGCIAGSFIFSPLFVPRISWRFDGVNPNRVTFTIDLRRERDELWSGISKSARWSVRTAERRGIKVRETDDFNQWMEFHRIHLEEANRKAYEHMALSESSIRWIYEVLRPKGKCVLLVALYGDAVVAGSLLYLTRKTMHWVRNASDPRYLIHQPNDALVWAAMMLGRDRGISLLDLFGAPKRKITVKNGIYQFKSKWGGKEIPDPVYLLGKAYSMAARLQGSSSRARRVIDFLNASMVHA